MLIYCTFVLLVDLLVYIAQFCELFAGEFNEHVWIHFLLR